jgi:steroid delta-isomerase-like uncharacterized protein
VTDAERNKAIVRAFVDAVNARDWPALDALVAPGFVRHSTAGGQPGVGSRADLVRVLRSECDTFPDAHEQVEDLVAEGDRVAVRHRFTGTQRGALGRYPASGKVMTADYIAIYRLERRRIVEAWAEWDNLTSLMQLGHYTSSD